MAKFFTPYTTTKKVVQEFIEPSLTDQSYKDECDLGFIIENYVSKGIPIPQSSMSYKDCTSVQDYQSAMMLVAEAKSNFEQLPSNARDYFGTVENYLDFISKPENLKVSYEKGYIDPSSVDLIDVYPERFQKVNEQLEQDNNTVLNGGDTIIPPSNNDTIV